MASLKYRCLTPGAKTVIYDVAASQKFYHECVNFVYLLDTNHISTAISTTTAYLGAVVDVPAGQGANTSTDTTYWQSSATSGVDQLPVVVQSGAQFLAPCSTTVTAAMLGGAWDIFIDASSTCMEVDVTASSTDVIIVDHLGTSIYGGSATDAIVHINPIKFQAD